MPIQAKVVRGLIVAAIAALAFQNATAQSGEAKANAGTTGGPDVAKTIKAAADALGMPRTGGPGGAGLPEVDVVNRMEFWGSGTAYVADPSKPGVPRTAVKTEYHAALGYNPTAMRVEMTPTNSDGAAPQHTIQTVRDSYAWNESQIGAGLEPGKGTATPAMGAVKNRLLQLWILPYGVVKAAIAAGDKAKSSTENGATVITFPLSGELAGITVKATLDAKNFVTKVEAQTDNPAFSDLVRETEYSDYADHGEILTDIKSPGRIVQKQGGSPVLDIQIKMWDANNPYLVFPIPGNVKNATAPGQSASRQP
ncbi:MAG TPA: hypothetical protein VEL77_08445 [Rugosimonospora sp.]|nr:hypothetical protein [Rugosimonospora sp.]